jgi:hypothetical protein
MNHTTSPKMSQHISPWMYSWTRLPSFDELCQYALLHSSHTTTVKDDLLVIHAMAQREDGRIVHGHVHLSIFKSSWDGQVNVQGELDGPCSFHITAVLTRDRLFYQVYPVPVFVTIPQFPCPVTFSIPWYPENDGEYVLYQVLGIKCRVRKKSVSFSE